MTISKVDSLGYKGSRAMIKYIKIHLPKITNPLQGSEQAVT